MSTTRPKIISIIDEDGNKLPKNMSIQFRQVQAGLEYLKDSADTVTTELKGVNHKLKLNTTDLGQISKKVNEIETDLKKHIKVTQQNFKSLEKMNNAMLELMKSIYSEVEKQNTRISSLEK